MKIRLWLVAGLLLFSHAQAVTRVPGTWTYYSKSVDPITDVNTGWVSIDELNDTSGSTRLTFKCSDSTRPELWAMLTSKNPLVGSDGETLPTVTVRVGTGQPQTVYSDSLYATTLHGEVSPFSIGFPGGITRQMAAGLYQGERVALRIERSRSVGSQTLTYVFPAGGFKDAWNAVNRCQQGQPAPAPVPAPGRSAATGAPKFTRWFFTTCTDTASGAVRSQLRAGQTHRCQLVIETVPNGAQPVRAEFSYELEYQEGGRTQKLTLETRDVWNGQGGPVLFRQDGSSLIFNLPLNVRSRAERRYTSLNVTADVTFSNGSSKRVYEKLPVQ
ncbi:hypothetical protein ACFP81_12295 [Deinococcus lacus]|uniref:Uncharacterized protein n=1 Tax=Deinococcus lacus TaxID=392561 RepID=A0ABW1YEE2_9DEIO